MGIVIVCFGLIVLVGLLSVMALYQSARKADQEEQEREFQETQAYRQSLQATFWADPDNAPPAFQDVLPHEYQAHETLRCCVQCGGGKNHQIHRTNPTQVLRNGIDGLVPDPRTYKACFTCGANGPCSHRGTELEYAPWEI